MARKAFILLRNYTDGSPRTETSVEGVYASREEAESAIPEGAFTVDQMSLIGGSWYEIEEWEIQEQIAVRRAAKLPGAALPQSIDSIAVERENES